MGRPKYLYVRPGHEYNLRKISFKIVVYVLTIYLILKRSHYRI